MALIFEVLEVHHFKGLHGKQYHVIPLHATEKVRICADFSQGSHSCAQKLLSIQRIEKSWGALVFFFFISAAQRGSSHKQRPADASPRRSIRALRSLTSRSLSSDHAQFAN